jgi:hypothetical protein
MLPVLSDYYRQSLVGEEKRGKDCITNKKESQ